MKKKIFSILILMSLLIIAPVHAKEINEFHTEANENISFKDTVNGDSAIAGTLVDIIGNINGLGFIAGETVNINGNLDYGFIAGDEINVSGTIEKNIYAAGNNINITKDATIKQDLFLAGSTITINNKNSRDIKAIADKIIIKEGTIITGNIDLNTTNLIIENNVTIKGELKYNEDAKTSVNENAQIGQTETYKIKENTEIDTNEILATILNMVVVFLVITILIPKTFEKQERIYQNKNNYFKNIGIGFLLLLCTPVIALMLLISNIGVSLGLILTTIYIVAIYLSFIITGFIIGDLLLVKLLKLKTNNYLTGIIGIILLEILTVIPVLGTIITILAIPLGLATIWNLIQTEEDINKKAKNIKEAKIIKK